MPRIFRISLLFVILPACICAQDAGDAYIMVSSNLTQGLVLVDSTYVGTVGEGRLIRVAAGSHRVIVSPEEVGSWIVARPETLVLATAGDTVAVDLDFPITYRIDSKPFGASVFREDEDLLLGETPLVFHTETALRAALILEKAGYATERILPGTGVLNQHTVSLRPLDGRSNTSDAVEWSPPASRHKWVTYSALGLVVAGGALAVHFKFRADDKYEEYLTTAEPDTKSEVDRLDRLSYVALGGMQVGLGVLAYRLAF